MAIRSDSEDSESVQLDYGCGPTLLTAIIMIGLISFNSFVVNMLVEQMAQTYAGFTEMPRIQRALQIVSPVLLLVFQYWIYDFFRDRLWSNSDHQISNS